MVTAFDPLPNYNPGKPHFYQWGQPAVCETPPRQPRFLSFRNEIPAMSGMLRIQGETEWEVP